MVEGEVDEYFVGGHHGPETTAGHVVPCKKTGPAGQYAGVDMVVPILKVEKRAVVDDGDVLTEAFSLYANVVRRYALVHLGRDAADDVVTETFLVAWRRLDEMPASPLAWLLGVARRVVRTQLRAQARQAQLASRLADEYRAANHSGVGAEERIVLAAQLAEMSHEDRDVLVIWAWLDLNGHDAAKVLGCSRAAYYVRLHRARRRLGERLRFNEDAREREGDPRERG